MTSMLFTNARIATGSGLVDGGWLTVAGGRITGFGRQEPPTDAGDGEVVDVAGAWLLPGFVDVHVHGALGHEAMDGDVSGLARMSELYARHGVTAFLPTTWTAGTDDTYAALQGIAHARQQVDGGARILGAHMEGPYLNPRRCGAQDPDLIRPADPDEASRFLDLDVVRLITVAPEVEGNLALVDECARRGITVSAGHTDATYEQLAEAVAHGVSHVTHTYNAMRPLHHREPGAVGAALRMPELTVELVADNVHVHPVAMRILLDARGSQAVVLVTDATRATGLRAGEYELGGRTVTVSDGAVRLPDGALAGSVLTFDRGVRHLRDATGRPLADLWPAASRNAARVAGVGERKGAIAVGMDADLVVVDDDVSVRLTVVEGRVVHRVEASSSVP